MKYLKELWDEHEVDKRKNDPLDLLRYRSNLLGVDLRITNFGGGNTSSKFELPDPLTGQPVRVLAVKGSGGDLGSIEKEGFALLYLDGLEQLQSIYRGENHEDEMVSYYPLCLFGENRVAPSIDTALHAFLPFPHVDHTHPDWAIALAASANGKDKLEEFNRRFNRDLAWVPWQRPGFELALMLKHIVEANPKCEGLILGSHGLFTWGETQRECYTNTLSIIDQLGEFVLEHQERVGDDLFGGAEYKIRENARHLAAAALPYLRGKLASQKRLVGNYDNSPTVMEFVNSGHAQALSRLGTSCPDHFIRTKIRPLYIDWSPHEEDLGQLKQKIGPAVDKYRGEYVEYYQSFAQPGSPTLRDPNPTVVLIPGLGMFTFGKNKKEARITSEFYINAIHVMEGATALCTDGGEPEVCPQAKRGEDSRHFTSFWNYVALPVKEAFRIEYWALEEAKLRRQPAEKEFSRKIFLVVGGGSGIGRETARHLAELGAHVVVADKNAEAAAVSAAEASEVSSRAAVKSCVLDLVDPSSIAKALKETVLEFGGLDGVINTAALAPVGDEAGSSLNEIWNRTLEVNVTGNFLLAEEARKLFAEQQLSAVIVLTSSANAIVPKQGSEPYDVSKTAVSHLIRELAIGLAPLVRVNGIAPATVVQGSLMFPRERVISRLKHYEIPYEENEPTDLLRDKLAEVYARRTLMKEPITPADCAEAICWLASDRSANTTGHIIPVDGGLKEAFMR
ncbi:bifunctional rhamnulose-1-phosphate aldolase/short-chain dehydrogenase [Acidobacteria bacterium AH-259-O06]|nr:bifunctional rhamnulose-1-phosphate aldolase/short-chain dehydrogenase [Acidobacteria bacterium AH-259-O06]